MGILLDPSDLGGAVKRYDFAYLMTSSSQGAPHAVAVWPNLDSNGDLIVYGAGSHTRENLAQRPLVALVWPPDTANGRSLIVDGKAAVSGQSIRISPIRAVLHCTAPDEGDVSLGGSRAARFPQASNSVSAIN